MKKACYHAILLVALIVSSMTLVGTMDFAAAVQMHLSVKGAKASMSAGESLSFNASCLDPLNKIVGTYAGNVVFTSSDPNAVFPSSLSLKSGTAVFTATLKTAGVQTITVTDTIDSILTATVSITVNPGAVSTFEVETRTIASVGVPLSVMVTAHDSCGNVVTSYSGTVDFSSTDSQANFPASTAMTSGRGKFSVTLSTVGTQTVTVSDSVNHGIAGTSNQISVGSGETEQPPSEVTPTPTSESTVSPTETPTATLVSTPTPIPTQEETKNAQALPMEAIVGVMVVVIVVVAIVGLLAMRKRKKE
jgi:hypothetical protein